MTPITSVGIVLAGIAVRRLLQVRGRDRLRRAMASLVALLGAISFVESLSSLSPVASAIANLACQEPPANPRASPLTGASLFFLGIAILLSGSRAAGQQCPGQWMTGIPLLVALVALVGHSFDVDHFTQIQDHSAMGFLAGGCIVLLSFSTLASRPECRPAALFISDNLGGYVARRVVPATVAFPFGASWLWLESQEHELLGPEMGMALLAVATIVFFTLLVTDVAEKLGALDEERSRSTALLRGTIEGTADFVAILDRDFRWIAFNEAHALEFREIYGETPVLGASMIDTMAPQDSAAGRAIWQRALGGESLSSTQEFGDPKRSRRWYEMRFVPIRDHGGAVVAAAQIVRDMTPWREAQENLREARDSAEQSANRLHAIVHSMTEGLVVFDANAGLVEANSVALATLGFESLAAAQQQAAGLFGILSARDPEGKITSPEEWPHVRALRGERFLNYELLLRRADELRPLVVDFGGAPVRNSAGEILFAVVTLRDVTREREAQEQLQVARAQLEGHARDLEATVRERTAKLTENLHEMERFSYSLSHDLRAPLRAMKGFSQILGVEYADKLGAAGLQHLERISAAAGRLDQLIQDVLIYSKIVREQIKLEPIDVLSVVRQLIHENPSFQSPRAEIEIIDPVSPVMGHMAYLTQVLSNLLDNAVKFVAPGTVPHVTFSSIRHGDVVRLCVKDNGIGISKEAQSRLFGMFERLNPNYEGTGIGLNIVRKAVERMSGTVTIESEPGSGSTFCIELKAAPPA